MRRVGRGIVQIARQRPEDPRAALCFRIQNFLGKGYSDFNLYVYFQSGFPYDGDQWISVMGYKAVCEHAPDLVILHLMLPKLSGYDLCPRVRG